MDKDQRKRLREEFDKIKVHMGVFKITNTVNGKIYVGSAPNLKNKWLTLKGALQMGNFMNSALQKDWNEYGEESFAYEVLEEKSDEDVNDKHWEIKQMELLWLSELEPFGDRGYNHPPK